MATGETPSVDATMRLESLRALVGCVVPEIKNALVPIKTYVQLLPRRYQDAEFRRDLGELVLPQLERIDRLAWALMAWAHPFAPRSSDVNVSETIDTVIALLDREINQGGIQVVRDHPEEPVTIPGDRERLLQVFLHLLRNAVEATAGRPTRRVEVTVECTGTSGQGDWGRSAVVVRIADTGAGIPKEHLSRIFEPLFSTKEDCAGLGLFICNSILEEHCAGIDVESVVGRGTTFTVTFRG